MIELDVLDHHIEKAKVKSEDMGRLTNSIRNGEGNLCGFIGEAVLEEYLGAKEANTYDYDLILPNGKTVDVKTKLSKMKPLSYYVCSVAAFNTKQKCDYYAFVRVNTDLTKAWFLGMIDKKDYFTEAELLKKGDKDGDNGYIVRADCYNLPIQDLPSP